MHEFTYLSFSTRLRLYISAHAEQHLTSVRCCYQLAGPLLHESSGLFLWFLAVLLLLLLVKTQQLQNQLFSSIWIEGQTTELPLFLSSWFTYLSFSTRLGLSLHVQNSTLHQLAKSCRENYVRHQSGIRVCGLAQAKMPQLFEEEVAKCNTLKEVRRIALRVGFNTAVQDSLSPVKAIYTDILCRLQFNDSFIQAFSASASEISKFWSVPYSLLIPC